MKASWASTFLYSFALASAYDFPLRDLRSKTGKNFGTFEELGIGTCTDENGNEYGGVGVVRSDDKDFTIKRCKRQCSEFGKEGLRGAELGSYISDTERAYCACLFDAGEYPETPKGWEREDFPGTGPVNGTNATEADAYCLRYTPVDVPNTKAGKDPSTKTGKISKSAKRAKAGQCVPLEGTSCGENDENVQVCRHTDDEGQPIRKTFCVSTDEANNLLQSDPQNYCGPCEYQEDDPLGKDPLDPVEGPVTYPYLTLLSPVVKAFNPQTIDLCVGLENAEFNLTTVSLNVNEEQVDPTFQNATQICVEEFIFENGLNTIDVSAVDSTGDFNLSIHRQIWAGPHSVTINIEDESGNPVLNATVTAQLSDDALVQSTISTTNGIAVFGNLPTRSISFVGKGPNGEYGTAGVVAGSASFDTITLVGFSEPSPVDNKDFSLGTEGWEADAAQSLYTTVHEEDVGPGPQNITLSSEDVKIRFVDPDERQKNSAQFLEAKDPEEAGDISNNDMLLGNDRSLQLNQDLVLGTGPEGESRTSYTFTSSEGACHVEVRYRFVTSEVPGGYCGTQYNDYYSVNIRSLTAGDSIVVSNSMNGLGCGSFDAGGSTNWFEATLELDASDPDTVQVDLVVANVGDGLYDSQIYVDFVKEIFPDPDVTDDPCACAQCKAWFEEQIADRDWIDDLPVCPCSVEEGFWPCTVRPTGADSGTGTRDGVNWDTDPAMNPCLDLGFHPGASTCIRAAGPNGTGQQCCYGADNNILNHGTPGAGTPDRNQPSHSEGDVDTYTTCCTQCPSLCELYIGKEDGTPGARSDPRHSPTGCGPP